MTTALAYDMASKLLSTKDILEKYELSKDELQIIISSKEFKTLYREAKLAWESDSKTRITFETFLQDIGGQIN